MARKSRSALAFALSAVLALGTLPAPALAEMAEEAMGTEQVAATQPAPKPATDPAPARPAAPAEAQMGEEPVAPQSDPAPAVDPAPVEAELGTAPIADVAPEADPTTKPTTATGTWGDCQWEIYSFDTLVVHPGEGSELQQTDWGMNVSPWNAYREQLKSVKFQAEDGQKVVLPANCSNMFANFEFVTSMDLSGADTSSVTNMRAMFNGCSRLASLDLSGWNTSNVTDLSELFRACSSLTSLNLSDWDVSKVTNMQEMFNVCSSLASVGDLSKWNTSSVEHMSRLFGSCSSLASVGDLSKWNTSSVESMGFMFSGCSELTTVGDISHWNTSKLNDVVGMFSLCGSLASLNLSDWDVSGVTDFTNMFGTCSSLTSVNLSNWNVSNAKQLTSMFFDCSSLTSVDLSKWNVSSATSMASMFRNCSLLASLDSISGWNTLALEDTDSMFSGCSSLSSLDLSDWDVSKLTRMGFMFYGCSSLTSVGDPSSWSAMSPTDINCLFSGCDKLANLDFVSGWNTSSVTSMSSVFQNCSSLASLNLSGWDTSNVTSTTNMFSGCSELATVGNLSGWDTSKVQRVDGMFEGCSKLASLDLSGWDTSNVSVETRFNYYYGETPFKNMFDGCDSLSRISVGADYAMKARGMFPTEPAGRMWHSVATGRTFSGDEVVASRSGVADTYSLEEEGITPVPTSLGGTDWSAVYDPEWYASKNPDVANWARRADGSVDGDRLLSHFVNSGRKEGRASKQGFELASYYNANADLRRAFGSNWARYYDHYRSSGQREGRACSGVDALRGAVTLRDGVDWSPVYDPAYYAQRNPDVASWATRRFASGSVVDDAALLQHFASSGTKECRSGKAGFDVRSYYNANSDLRMAFGGSADWTRYYRHYATNGSREGRKCTGADQLQGAVTKLNGADWSPVYDRAYYGQRNPDIVTWATRKCGSTTVLDDYAMLTHFVNNGRKEGRASKQSFELASYYNANADLRRAFGTDWARYYDHYRGNGQREGRACAGVTQLQSAPTTAENVNWAPVYDANYYVQRNADVANWARRSFASGSVLDDAALLSHFVNSGTKEARASKQTFDVRAYKGKNADLARAFGNDWKSYYRHYALYGVNEHRPCA